MILLTQQRGARAGAQQLELCFVSQLHSAIPAVTNESTAGSNLHLQTHLTHPTFQELGHGWHRRGRGVLWPRDVQG